MKEFQRYVISRLKEASTWRGIVLIGTAMGIVPETHSEAILQLGLAIAGVMGAVFPDYRD